MKRHFIGKKNILLSIVALVLVMMLVVGVSYSWIEDLKMVQFSSTNTGTNTPLKTGFKINSTIKITDTNNTVNLGSMLTNTLETDKLSSTDKGFFYESGDMHLSGCYSDGKNFFFPKHDVNGNAGAAPNYRLGGKDDENVNYISFTFKMLCEDSNVDIWFKDTPSISTGGTALDAARFALTVDGVTNLYSSDGTANTVSGITAASTQSVSDVRDYDDYVYDGTDATAANTVNTVFSLTKGKISTITVKIWLEGNIAANISTTDISLKLGTSRNLSRKINLRDFSSSKGGTSWLGNSNMFMAIPAAQTDGQYVLNESYWPLKVKTVNSERIYYPTATAAAGDTTEVEIPAIYNGEKVYFFRCNGQWNKSDSSGTARVLPFEGHYEAASERIKAWNYWVSYIPRDFSSTVYTVYGNTFDNNATGRVGGDATYKGNGTWSDVETITIDDPNGQVPNTGNSNDYQMYMIDYTEENTTGNIGFQEMSWNSTTSKWWARVPTSSFRLQIQYFAKPTTYKWSYNSDVMKSQVRPTGSLEYRILKRDGTSGSGYWVDSSNSDYKIYFINDDGYSSVYSYVWEGITTTHHKLHGDYPGTALSTDGTVTKSSNTYNVYSDAVGDCAVSGETTYYNQVIFNAKSESNKTADLTLYPGMYYSKTDTKWYEDLDSYVSGTGGGGGGGGGQTSTDTDTMDGYNDNSTFYFKIGNDPYYFKKKANTYNVGDTFKLKLNYTAANQYKWGTIFNTAHNNDQFARGTQSQFVSAPYSNGDFGISIQGNNTNSFGLTNGSNIGDLIVTIKITRVNNSAPDELQIISFLPEAT